MLVEKQTPMTDFTPQPYCVVESPEQIKAFTDPLRVRVLGILRRRAATNQQIADELGETHAKVLYHIRFLQNAGLIKLVETQVKGGNVEKYYRAVAQIFDIRPAPGDVQRDVALIKPVLDRVRAEMLASVMLFPSEVAYFHNRTAHLTPEQLESFNQRLVELIAEYWQPETPSDPSAVEVRLGAFMYRDPGDLMHE